MISYLITLVSALVVALLLKLPLLPEGPMRDSWTISAVFPTSVIALGLLAIFLQLNVTGFYSGWDVAVIVGVFSAFFSRYLLEDVFPKFEMEESYE